MASWASYVFVHVFAFTIDHNLFVFLFLRGKLHAKVFFSRRTTYKRLVMDSTYYVSENCNKYIDL